MKKIRRGKLHNILSRLRDEIGILETDLNLTGSCLYLGSKGIATNTARFLNTHKATGLLLGTTVGMQAIAAHYDMPGYGIPLTDETTISRLKEIGNELATEAYALSATISHATTNFDPLQPFFYKDILQNKAVSLFYNCVHHLIGGLAGGYLAHRYLIRPRERRAEEAKDILSQKSVEVEEFIKENDKVTRGLSNAAYWSSVSVVFLLWEAYEMNFFSDRLIELPTIFTDPDTYDGLKDMGFNYLGAALIRYNKDIRGVFSRFNPNSSDVPEHRSGGGKL